MKKILLTFAAMLALAACGNNQAAIPVEEGETNDEVAFEVATTTMSATFLSATTYS